MAAVTTGLLGKNVRGKIASLASRSTVIYSFYQEQGNRAKQFAQVSAGSVVVMGHKISHRLCECPTDTATSTSSEKQPHGVLCTAGVAPLSLR